MPVYRPAASSILRSFRASGKRHLLLTGGRGSGKTTLLRALMPSLCPDAPMLLTAAVPGRWVEMRDTAAGAAAVIGRFDAALPPGENRMRPVPAGFAAVGLPALQRMAAAGGWAVLDELGYLESGCADFQQSVLDMLKVCRVLAVVRKQDTPFLRALCADPDAFVYDLDCPVPPLGCIVMASGLGRRFGGNKLMAELNGRPLAAHALALAAAPVFAGRIAVTRSAAVEALCRAEGFPVLRHAEPRRTRSGGRPHPMAHRAALCCSVGIILLPSFTCRRAAAAAPCCAPTRRRSACCPPPPPSCGTSTPAAT